VGLGLRPPLAYIDPLEIKTKEAVNSEQAFVPNIAAGIQSTAATEVYSAKVTASSPLARLFRRPMWARETKTHSADLGAPFASKTFENLKQQK
jgi:hypothetical protein